MLLSFLLVENKTKTLTTLVVLAGGKAARMQSLKTSDEKKTQRTQNIDKAHLLVGGTSLVERTLEQLQHNAFVARAINANAELETFRDIAKTMTYQLTATFRHRSERIAFQRNKAGSNNSASASSANGRNIKSQPKDLNQK